jgi:hypothetical protein
MRLLRILAAGAMVLAVTLPGTARAQDFEGVIKQRTITVAEEALYELLAAGEEEPEEIGPEAVFEIPIERIVALSGTDAVEVEELSYYMKGDQIRIDDAGGGFGGYALMDFESGAFRLVQPERQMYLEITKADIEELQTRYGDMGMDEGERSDVQVRALGVSKEINGMTCSAYEILTDGEVTQAWVTEELKDLVDAFSSFMDRMEALGMDEEDSEDVEVMELIKEHGFPVMEQTFREYGSWGAEYEIKEIMSVERKSVQEELFAVPADYEKKSMMEMMQMFEGN